ncbi:MAG: hypothetical protein EBX41_06820 [Chitinophagia bacterium]|nr:hypothetical protein [Chitinophagia bacterium]
MIALSGTFHNGQIVLDEPCRLTDPVKVIVTFIEDDLPKDNIIPKPLNYNSYSFGKVRELLTGIKDNISDEIIRDRRG